MVFSSLEYIFLFLPAVVTIFWLVTEKLSLKVIALWLVLSSLFYYSWWAPKYLTVILFSIFCNYYWGKILFKQKSKLFFRYQYQ